MAFKFEIIENSLVITDDVNNEVLLDSPKREVYYDSEALKKDFATIYDTSSLNKKDSKVFNCAFAYAIKADGAAFTKTAFVEFCRANLGFNLGGDSGEGLTLLDVENLLDQKLLEERSESIFSGATIYQNIFDAKNDSIALKVGNPSYNDTTYINGWNGRPILKYGANNEADGNGMLVTMPTDKDVLWLRFLGGDRWNVVKVYDDLGNQFGKWSAGYRDNNTITPDGALEDSNSVYHQWIPINVKGHSGKLYVISKPNTSAEFWCSGIAFTNNPLGLTWLSAVGLHWAINGGNGINWDSSQWHNDNLAEIHANTFDTMKIPVVENGKDKLFFLNLHGNNWNEGGHTAVYVNGAKLDNRLSEQWNNPFFRQRNANLYNHMVAVKVPQTLIPTGATYIDVQIDTRIHNNTRLHVREAGTLNQ